jgi:Domain of unknown function (DUF4249)
MNKRIYILALLMMALGCQKPYQPRITAVASNYLVVEGVINTGSDSTIVRLSRTVPLTSTAPVSPELGASVTILSNSGGNYPLFETGNGYYKSPGLNLSSSNTYSLKIVTSGGKTYQSDFVPSKTSPPIDSVYYRIQSNGNGLNIFADTHDPSRNSNYYRWDYQETYIIHSAFSSGLYLQTQPFDTVLTRPGADEIYTCWINDSSSNIIINSSAKLSKDVIADNQVTSIASTSEKIGSRYSILVKQYVLTADAYNYYQQLKKNSERLGSIFDPQPSELPGNVHSVSNPSEPVIGYITAGTSSKSRIFIDTRKLPAWLPITPYGDCKIDTLLFQQPVGHIFQNFVQMYIYSGDQIPLYIIAPPQSTVILGYAGSSPACVDCTLRGTNVQPSFWTNP